MTLILRPYQEQARDAVLNEWYEKGINNTIVISSTGTGKTIILLDIIERVLQRFELFRVLIVSHRAELVYQPIQRIESLFPALHALNPGIVMGDIDQPDRQIISSTIQTLSATKRLDSVLSYGDFTHLIIDECHHSASDTYLDLINRLREANPNLKILGVTATPKRTDGDGLSKVFQTVAYRITIRDAIRLGAIVPFSAMAVELPVSVKDVPISGNEYDTDWDNEALGNVMKMDNAQDIIIDTWLKHALERSTIAFCASVPQAKDLADAFTLVGIKAIAIDDSTKKEVRKQALLDFLSGDIRIICNYGIFTEGTDLPIASCALMARPMKSDLTYLQAIGRAMRLYPGKSDALILDFAPFDARDMRMAGDVLGKSLAQKKLEAKALKKGIILDCFGVKNDGEFCLDGDIDQVLLTIINYFEDNQLCWNYSGDIASVAIARDKSIAIVMPNKERVAKAELLKQQGKWDQSFELKYKAISGHQVYVLEERKLTLLGIAQDWQAACYIASDYSDINADALMSNRKKKWRSGKVSDKQKALLERLGLWSEGTNKGLAARKLTHYFAMQALRKARIL